MEIPQLLSLSWSFDIVEIVSYLLTFFSDKIHYQYSLFCSYMVVCYTHYLLSFANILVH